MRRIIFCLSLFLVTCWPPVLAKQNRSVTNNYHRGRIAFQNGDAWGALRYLEKELKENPNNGYASFWLALVYESQGNYKRALAEIDAAIKKIPRRDKSYRSVAEVVRLKIYNEESAIEEVWRWLESLHAYAR